MWVIPLSETKVFLPKKSAALSVSTKVAMKAKKLRSKERET